MNDAKPKGLQGKSSGGNKSRGNRGSKPIGDITFININLSDAQKSACGKWIASGVDVQQALEGVLASEYKLGFAYDVRNGAYIVSITDRREDSEFFAHCYSLRSSDPITALLRVIWVHAVFSEGDWGVLVASVKNQADW